MEILTEPKNALVRQYQRMFEIDGVELEFEQDALEAIADLAVLRQTGARGLRAIIEEVLGPIMFEVPSSDEVARVVVTKDAVLENAAPTIVPRKAPSHREVRLAGPAQPARGWPRAPLGKSFQRGGAARRVPAAPARRPPDPAGARARSTRRSRG